MNRNSTTHNRLREAMNNAGKKQSELANEVGINKGTISRYLSGEYEPKQDIIYKLAKALDVSEMWLWGYDCPMERTEIQKNNDTLADIIVRLRTDKNFYDVAKSLYELDEAKLSGVRQMLNAFLK